MSAKVQITGLKAVQVQFEKLARTLPKNVDAVLSAGVDKMVRDAKADVPVDMGVMKGGITKQKNGEADYSMVSNASYSAYIEFGTKGNYTPIPGVDASEFKGKGDRDGKFFENILAWVKRKKLAGTYSVKTRRRTGKKADRQREDEQVAFAIYLSILKHGIKPHPFFFKQGDKHGPAIIKAIEQLAKQANG